MNQKTKTLGHYKLLEAIDEGSTCTVHMALDTKSG